MERTTGHIISQARRQKGLTQKQLGELLGVTDKAVSKWERDIAKPDVTLIPQLADILELPVELLLNVPVTQQKEQQARRNAIARRRATEAEEAWQNERAVYQDRVQYLLKKARWGFIIGIVWCGILAGSSGTASLWEILILMLLGGCYFAGIPYGWDLLNRLISGWYIVGSIPVMLIAWMCKFIGAVIIGWVAFPIALFYNLMHCQKRDSTARKVYMIIFGVIVGFWLVLILAFVISSSVKKSERNAERIAAFQAAQNEITTETTTSVHFAEAADFYPENTAYQVFVQDAAERTDIQAEGSSNTGCTILEPTLIRAAYYLSVKNSDGKHVDAWHNVQMSTALAIVTTYKVDIAGATQRYNWFTWVYPDIQMDETGSFIYTEDDVHGSFTLAIDTEEMYEKICTEYYDMNITQLELPQSYRP